MKTFSRFILCLILLGQLNWGLLAQVSSLRLDSSFAGNGFAFAEVNAGTPGAMDWQSDGKMIWAGEMFNNQIFIGRLHPDGRVDSSFATNGFFTMMKGSFARKVRFLKVSDNDKISCVFTYSNNPSAGLVYIRLNRNGDWDSDFGDLGIREMTFPGLANIVSASSLLNSEGMLYLGVGVSDTQGNFKGGIVKLTSEGLADASFGQQGLLVLDSLDATFEGVSALCFDPQGNILASGVRQTGNGEGWVTVYKIDKDGLPVMSFGNNGLVSYLQRNKDGYKTQASRPDMKVSPDGSILLSGIITYGQFNDLAFMRLLPNGELDTNFGVNGQISQGVGNNPIDFDKLVWLKDGRMLNAGMFGSSSASVMFFAKTAKGHTDSTVFYLHEALQIRYFGEYALSYSANSTLNLEFLHYLPENNQIYAGFNVSGPSSSGIALARFVVDERAEGIPFVENTLRGNLYPNPAQFSANLVSNHRLKCEDFRVLSVEGRQVNARFYPGQENQIRIDLSALSPGLYFVYHPDLKGLERLIVRE